MKIVAIAKLIIAVLFVGIVATYVVTFWAIGKSRAREQCYRAKQSIDQCDQPGAFERTIRAVLAP